MIAVVDYGAGNLHSVQNALNYIGVENTITGEAQAIRRADKVILPGVGAFGDAMKSLEAAGLSEVVRDTVKEEKPLLGICLGLHLLFEESEESPGIPGLGILPGKIVKIPARPQLKIPHIGWNSITLTKKSRILEDLPKEPFVYFVHSYYAKPQDPKVVSATVEYGTELEIAVEAGNLFATQFHPEKSGKTGLKILENFARLEV